MAAAVTGASGRVFQLFQVEGWETTAGCDRVPGQYMTTRRSCTARLLAALGLLPLVSLYLLNMARGSNVSQQLNGLDDLRRTGHRR